MPNDTNDTQQTSPTPFRRSLVLADFITLTNGAAGTLAILMCIAYTDTGESNAMWSVFTLLPLALICDIADGMVARWRRRQSPFGADLDSLADVVSFGVAPAALGFTLGLRGGWDMLILVYFVGCGVARLARFNVLADQVKNEQGKVTHYEGTPIPFSLLVVGVLLIAYAQGAVHDALWLGTVAIGPWDFHPLSLCFALSGTGMISFFIRIPKP